MTDKEEKKSFFILSIINQQGSKGTTTKDLSEKTVIDRWTIGDICKKLELEGCIEKKKKGKSNGIEGSRASRLRRHFAFACAVVAMVFARVDDNFG